MAELPCLNITFIGTGKMTSALGLGIVRANILGNNSCITLSNPSKRFGTFEQRFNKIIKENLNKTSKKVKLTATDDNIQSIKNANIVILAVRPDVIPIVLKQLAPHWTGMFDLCIQAHTQSFQL